MADTKISALDAITAILGEMLFAVVSTPSGTAKTEKATITQVVTFLNSITQILTNKSIDQDGTGNSITNIANASIKSAAAIDLNKLAALTASMAVTVDASGFLVSSAGVTAAELEFLADVTGLIQAQLDGKGTGNGDALVANPLSQFAATTSLQLIGVISDETGSGKLAFATAPTLDSPSISYAINAQTGTTYTLALLDAGKIVTSSNAATVVITIPPNSSVAYPIGSSITVVSIGAGLTNFAIGSGVTINSTGAVPAAPVLRVQYSSATAIKTATDTWVVVGDIS